MIYVGIDVAKDKHDCSILKSTSNTPVAIFTIQNNREGYIKLIREIRALSPQRSQVQIGIEATGHYEYNLLSFLLNKGFSISRANPLMMKKYKEKSSLRKTKTDKVDATSIAKALREGAAGFNPYSLLVYHNEELKALTRYRRKLIEKRANEKTSIRRLVSNLFPEMNNVLPSPYCATSIGILSIAPSAQDIAKMPTRQLADTISVASHGRHGRELAICLHNLAKNSVGQTKISHILELQHSISLINIISDEIKNTEREISAIMKKRPSHITEIPGIGQFTAAEIIAEVGDFTLFDSPDKLLAFSGLSPTTYQSGQLINSGARLEKRGSRALRHSLFIAAEMVCRFDPYFNRYLAKKQAEGKHYYVAITHVAKKLVRLIYSLETKPHSYVIQGASLPANP